MIFAAVAIVALYCCSLFGWGALVRRLAGMSGGSWAVTIVLGMAAWVAIGGVLNLARLAGRPALGAMVVLGILLFAYAIWRARPRVRLPSRRVLAARALLMAMAAGVLVFTIATQLPPAVYNHYDDFEKYFAYPVRMLQTGTLLGSPLSALGWESLGGQAFLQGFIVAYFPIRYINGLDAVFALFLCLSMIAGFGWRRPAKLATAVLAMAAIIIVNPQYVNVSALYTGSALMMAAIFLAGDPAEAGAKPVSALALALVYAAAVALKPTFALFAGAHVVFVAASVAARARRPAQGLIWTAKVTGWGALFLAPWIALHGAHFIWRTADRIAGAAIGALPKAAARIEIFATDPLFYGGTAVQYTGLVVAAAICAVAVWRIRRATPIAAMGAIAGSAAVVFTYLASAYLWAPYLGDARTALRYFVPMIIAGLPAILCLSSLPRGAGPPEEKGLPRRLLPGLITLVVVASFVPEYVLRVRQASSDGSILAFRALARSKPFIRDSQALLNAGVRAKVARIQRLTPAGEPLIAWIQTPFYLDFSRNRVFDVDVAGFSTPWSNIPASRYVMWEYRGAGVRSPEFHKRQARRANIYDRKNATLGLAFYRRLEAWSKRADILYDDGKMMLFRRKENPSMRR